METRIIKLETSSRIAISREVAMAQIKKAIALQKKGVVKF